MRSIDIDWLPAGTFDRTWRVVVLPEPLSTLRMPRVDRAGKVNCCGVVELPKYASPVVEIDGTERSSF